MLRCILFITIVALHFNARLGLAQTSNSLVSVEPVMIEGSLARVLALAISADGKWLASGGYDHPGDESRRKSVRIWDLGTKKQFREIVLECDDIHALAFDTAGARVAIGDRNGSVTCWNVRDNKQLFVTPKSDAEMQGVVFSRDGKQVIGGGEKLWAWDSSTGMQVGEVKTHNDWAVNRLATSKDGALFLLGCGSEAAFVNAKNLQPLQLLQGQTSRVEAVAISNHKRAAATGCQDGTIKVWESRSGKESAAFAGHTDGVTCLAFIDQDRRLVSGGQDGKLRVWNLATKKQEQEIAASSLAIDALVVSQDGKTLIHNDVLQIHVRQVGKIP